MRCLTADTTTALQTLPRPWERPLSAGIAYVQSAATNIAATWRRHGWTPPSELPAYQAKWEQFRTTPHLITPASRGERNSA